MSTTLRLFSIEARRNAAIWFVPIIVGVSWWMLSTQYWTSFLWDDTNRLLQYTSVQFAGPAMAGVAAWMAGRDRRRSMKDLLDSTPRTGTSRRLILLAATALWGLVAYALFAAYVMGQTAFQATASGPAFWPVAVVVLALLAHTAWGFFAGKLLPSRFTAPLVGIAALGLQQYAAQHKEVFVDGGSMSTWVNQLAAHNGQSEWHAFLYLGLSAAALAAMALKDRQNIVRIAGLTVTAGLTIGAAVMIWGQYPRNDIVVYTEDGLTHVEPASRVQRNNFGQVISPREWPQPDPVCKGSSITVCTSPAYQSVLDQAIIDAATLIEPLNGLPGVPMRVEREDTGFNGGPNPYIDMSRFADKLVADESTLQDGAIVNEAQIAVRSWLLESGGWTWETGCFNNMQVNMGSEHWPGQPTTETCDATARFAALSTAEQRAWLEQHYTDLRTGNLTLDDLP